MNANPGDVGARVRQLRKRAGLKQAELGHLVGRSQAWVSAVEGGVLALDSVALIVQVAKALKAHPADLSGGPLGLRTDAEARTAGALDRIRQAVQRFDLAPDWPLESRPYDVLAADVQHLVSLRRSARYADLAEAVPDVIREVHAAVHTCAGAAQEQLFALLAAAYKEADTVAHTMGCDDLATLAVERFRWAAERAADPGLVAVGDFLRVRDLWALRLWADAMDVVDRRLASLEGADAAARTVAGGLHLRAAITAARALNAAEARTRISEALDITREVAGRGDPYGITFTPTNVGIHAVAVEVECGDGARALALAAATTLPEGTPRSRTGRYRLDVARACVLHGDHRGAVSNMLLAERLAPLLVRNNGHARAAVSAMLSHGRGGSDDRLRRLAGRMRMS